ncbi:MAG: AtzH-like domain-containing protein [Leptothrix sp. (in: b-proteobacteria)]
MNTGLRPDQIDRPEVLAEIEPIFDAYEAALMRNDAAALTDFFWADERVTRYGIADRQWGATALAAWRASVPALAFTRRLEHPRLLALGPDVVIAQVEFIRTDTALRGFQTQTWARLVGDDGTASWKIVTAHVSMIDWPG